jgi:vitamin B12 transporter
VNTWSREQELGVEMLSSKTWWNYPNYDFTDTTYSTGFARVDEQVNQFSMLTGYSKNQITNNWKSTVQLSGSNNSAQNNTLSSNDILYNPAFDLLWQNDFKINNDKFQFIAERKMQYAKMENSPVQTYGCSVDCLVNKYRVDDSVSTSYQARRGNNLANISIRTDQITGYNNQTTWSSAYGYLWTEQLRTNISYGTGFRAPSFNDLFYPGYGTSTLRPETNKNLEGAIRYESSQLNSQLSIYRNEIKNFILPVNCDGTITCPNYAYSGAFPLNVSDVMIKGLSLSADKKIGNLVFKGSADAMSTIDQTTGLDVPNRSKWAANGSIDYKIGYISFGSSITLSGNRWGAVTYNPSGNYNYQYMPSYTIVNLHASYQINKNLSAFGRANNIFDSQYQTSYGYSNGGTNVFMGLMYSL